MPAPAGRAAMYSKAREAGVVAGLYICSVAVALIMSLVHQDTALAEELYEILTHPELREGAAARLYRYWQDRDPDRARRYR